MRGPDRRAGSTSLAEAAGVAQRPGRRARAAQPDRPARGLHRLRRPGRGARRPRRERQGRAAPRRRRARRRGRAAGRLRQPPARLGRAVLPVAGRGHRQGVGPGDARANGSRPASAPRSRASARRSSSIDYVDDDADAVEAAMAGFVRGPDPVDLILTAGAASTDPLDAVLRGDRRARRAGRPARRPGASRARCSGWRASAGRRSSACRPAAPTRRRPPRTCCCRGCCPASGRRERTVAKLGHGGILTRSQRFRFPAYARELDAPDG